MARETKKHLRETEKFKLDFLYKLQTLHGKELEEASNNDKYTALVGVLRDRISQNWVATNRDYSEKSRKQVYYFSMEFLLGKLLPMYLINMGVHDVCRDALAELDIDIDKLTEAEPDAGLGNGGLGRLAACFMDSIAAMKLPGHGNGIRYRYGLFEQKIVDGHQVELPDNWLKDGYAWEYRRGDRATEVRFGGHVRTEATGNKLTFIHEGYEPVLAVPYDVPIIGHENNTVNTLRLWNAEPIEGEFDLPTFNRGDYLKAVEYKHSVERISKILYPEDNFYEGRLLRLKQQYFFVSAGIQSIIRRFKKRRGPIRALPDRVTIHINDTHPAVAVPELMRILMDEEGLGWDDAWDITTRTVSYTNHTIMPEALEKWPVQMFKTLLPRIYMIVEEINERYCRRLWQRYPGNWDKIAQMAIIADEQVHMARLAVVGSFSVNGVAALHTDILKKHLFHHYYEDMPHKFNNKTNGITHRRWLLRANRGLAEVLTDTIGKSWVEHPEDLTNLLKYDSDASVQEKLKQVKLQNKEHLARHIKEKYDVLVDPASIFDVQIKRIHAYKRQLLNVLHVMDLYNRLKDNPDLDIVPRTFLFGGKAAPGYYLAKQIIKLINMLAYKINNDLSIKGKLKVVFLENYSVSLGEMVFPASDVSEQISTASKEASGTGNMKFMLNGAVTMGTMDGANVEIRNAVGDDNIFIFGLNSDQVIDFYRYGGYKSYDCYNNDKRIKLILDQLVNGYLPGGKDEFRPIFDSLLRDNDEFFVLKDFDDYATAQERLDQRFRDQGVWSKMSIHNIAHAGIFSSDRSIAEYAIGIWNVKPAEIPRL
ncbi:glycogen/starch/alpha-glucan phosphorylase [Propionispora vibrioides]|uniref:Alpha-1,4 glucan phosphorylase n=1 Tax=Propionispora vibrioides TaxID=112903 RepID=A0A1H8Q2F7_9FIRM|nr:glycogen/starch/alpha-glucan phosphorylase [Propionispora vibrioides]SEO48188.1 starch phosphorylase [Propionispora vibrioides]